MLTTTGREAFTAAKIQINILENGGAVYKD
jgi:hypothetical protein